MKPFAQTPIVVPVDFSEESTKALDLALELAEGPETIHAVHVCPPSILYEAGGSAELPREHTAQEKYAAFRQHYPDARYAKVHFDVRFCDPADEIVGFAGLIDAGLIILSIHARAGITHFLFSSIAERVVRGAPCPVLVLPIPEIEDGSG
jgi:nucleotide-binding universal stress UspA family protein